MYCPAQPLAKAINHLTDYARPMGDSALAGIRVCDLSGQLAGAGATRFLAAFGAQVIRVEDPVRRGGWDILRGGRPYVDERRGPELGGSTTTTSASWE
jgi:crotonobetainyl-CoA:carnitine CoA-transferase CaiB-like acyl-CoA transferase